MHSIDPSKAATEITKSEAEISKEITHKNATTIADKERQAIGLLLKQTLQNIQKSGLLSVNTQKAVLSAKQIFPGEFAQLYIQDRLIQHKQAEAQLKAGESTAITPKELTLGTIRQWTSGQLLQSVVYQQTQNGTASLLLNSAGQFDPKLLSQLKLQSTDLQSQIKSVLEFLTKIANQPSTQTGAETAQTQLKLASEILSKVAAQVSTLAAAETPQTQIKLATEILSRVATQSSASTQVVSQPGADAPLTQIKSASEILSRVTTHLAQMNQTDNNRLANNPINNQIIKLSQLVQVKTDLQLQPGQQLLLQINKQAGEVSFQIQHTVKESHQASQYYNQHLIKQQAMPPLLATLKEISSQMNQVNTPFTRQFMQQVDRSIQQFPQLAELSSIKDIRNVLQNSGQFLENKLLTSVIQAMKLSDTQSKPITSNLIKQISQADLKANLAQLVAMIQRNEALVLFKNLSSGSSLYQSIEHKTIAELNMRLMQLFDLPSRVTHAQVQTPAPDSNLFQLNSHLMLQSKILNQLEGVLSRIIATQIHTREGGSEPIQLNFEIPFRNNDQQEVLQLKIREEHKESEAEKGNKIWTVNMAFHLPSIGGIRIYITMDKQELAMQFWTEEKNTQQLFQENFSLLSERLYDAGFTISQLAAFHGIPQAAQKEQQSSQFIIDERV